VPPEVAVYVETDVNMASTGGAVAWTFDLRWWGVVGQGDDEAAAVAALASRLGDVDVRVVERISGDEQAFARDLDPPRPDEVDATLAVLAAARVETLDLVANATPEDLDRADPTRRLPSWASWVTARDVAWHIADTESRYYLPSLGLPARDRLPDLIEELPASAVHVERVLAALPTTPLVRRERGEVWTSVKLLRRLAWHEPGELVVLRSLLGITPRPGG